MRSSDSGDIREGRERGEGERSQSDAREERGEKGDPSVGVIFVVL